MCIRDRRIGEVRRVVDESEFKVCADPENMPFSNLKREGFEDKIAEVLAADLGKKLTYTYAYSRQGFFRNTLGANRCDVVIGTTSDNDMMRTSKPYYLSLIHIYVASWQLTTLKMVHWHGRPTQQAQMLKY